MLPRQHILCEHNEWLDTLNIQRQVLNGLLLLHYSTQCVMFNAFIYFVMEFFVSGLVVALRQPGMAIYSYLCRVTIYYEKVYVMFSSTTENAEK